MIAASLAMTACGGAWYWRDELAVRFAPLSLLYWMDQWRLGDQSATGSELSDWANAIIFERSRRLMDSVKLDLQREVDAACAECSTDSSNRMAGYYTGGWWSTLALTPSGLFGFQHDEYSGCLGSSPARGNVGTARFGDTSIRLSPLFDPRLPHFECGTEFLIVPWRGCRLLIEAKNVPVFCRRLNAGDAIGAVSWGFRRTGDRFAHDQTLPRVPAEYEQYLILKPIQMTLVQIIDDTVDDIGFCRIRARFDRGADDGLILDTELFSTYTPYSDEQVKATAFVVELFAHECIADFLIHWPEWRSYDPPRVGMLYSTRDPYYDDATQYSLLDQWVFGDFGPPASASSE